MNDNQIIIDNNVITFNEEQYLVINEIRKWLKDEKIKFLTIKGQAGTGKTTIIKKIISEYSGNVIVSAPTHSAKKNISNITGINGVTLSSLLGLGVDELTDDFNPNNPKFKQINTPTIPKYDLVIIDEASQINKFLFGVILSEVNKIKIKIIIIGDPNQAPPINEDISEIFTSEHIKILNLNIIERQKNGNSIIYYSDEIVKNVNNLIPIENKINKLDENNDGVIFTSDKAFFRNKLIKYSSSLIDLNDITYTKALAWKNETVSELNKFIRCKLFGDGARIVERKDILFGYRNIKSKNMAYSVIENSQNYVVCNVSNLEKNEYDIYGYYVVIMEKNYDKNTHRKIFIVDHTIQNNFNLFGDFHDHLINVATKDKSKWKLYYDFRRNNITLKDNIQYSNGLLRDEDNIIRKDLDYGYAITIHKAQGATYKHVFVLDRDINVNSKIIERNKIKYVAISRAAKSATILY